MLGRGMTKALIVASTAALAACAQQEEPVAPAPAAPAPAAWETIAPSALEGRTLYLENGAVVTLQNGRFSGQGKGNAPAGDYTIQGQQICFETVAGESALPPGCYTPESRDGQARLVGQGGRTIGFGA